MIESVPAKTRPILSQLSNGVSTSSEGRKELSTVSIQCVCELLVEKPYFNFSSNLVNMVVGQLANETPNRRTARDCLAKLFQTDLVGEISYEVIRRLADVVKKKNYKLSPIVLQPLLHLPLGQDASGALTSSNVTDDYHRLVYFNVISFCLVYLIVLGESLVCLAKRRRYLR